MQNGLYEYIPSLTLDSLALAPGLKSNDEARHGGLYRTKETILQIYDALQESIRTGHPYQTLLDPPPADPRCCHPPKSVDVETQP